MEEKLKLLQNFSGRLVRLLIQNGYASRSAATGVKVRELAEMAGCSFEMARRYTSGNALPDPIAIKTIAEWLKVDPGWLLYGTHQEQNTSENAPLVLTMSDLKHLLEHIAPVYLKLESGNDAGILQLNEFFCDVIADFARMHSPIDVKLKILETSISSAIHFISSSVKNTSVVI
jgi:transcriptional regulator with XRE-family HTH domain